MKKKVFIFTLLVVITFPTAQLLAVVYTPTELINNALKLDKQEVELRGEAVGEIIERENGKCWINIFDGSNAIGVYINIEEARKIKTFGNQKLKGDIVFIKGKLFANDESTGGELDVQGKSLKVESVGHPIIYTVPLWKIIFAITGIISSALVFILWLNYEHHKKSAKEYSFDFENNINEDIE